MQANCRKQRVAASRGTLPIFAVGEYFLVAGATQRGSTPKLVMTWPGLGSCKVHK